MTVSKSALRKLSALLAALMVIGTLTVLPVFADSFSDISSHWAKANVEYMVRKEIISGYPDNTFRPDNIVTRAEFIKMLDATFGLTETASISYSDVPSSQWYYPYVQQAAAQGYLLNYGTSLNPNGELTREEAAALLARYLNLAEKDRASVGFTDASSINQNYRGYVYACVDAGIIKGYDTGDFKPQKTLTRAEAMAILYRSAGTIYRASAVGTDSEAQPGNATITKGGVNVSNATYSGSVYITEGAGSSTVTLSNCNIRGTLYMRGNSKVQLSGTTVANIVVMGKDSAFVGINLDETSTVNGIDAQSPVSLYLQRGSTVSTLTIGEHAEGSSASGTGRINQININGAKFKSDITPGNYNIGDRLTAEIGGQSVGGSGTSKTGIYPGVTPVISTSGARDTLTITPNQNSVLFWYYTNNTAAPSASDFRATYERQSSNVKGFQSLDQVQSYTVTMAASNIAAQYNNVVICLFANQEYFDPIIVSRTGSNNTGNSAAGFKTSPAVKTNPSTNLDTITFVPEVSGTMYYYYTTSPTNVTSQQFRTNYNAAGQGLRGSKTIIAGNSYAETTAYNMAISGSTYNYVAVMLTSGTSDYAPVVVTRNASDGSNTQASGLADAPVWTSYNGNESLR
ncbi:MAG: S-layer homology domain-containing protein, partial [Clostridiales bacterium]|nr:S-layer homology domain-containing protein [Clostridiales bacterium]